MVEQDDRLRAQRHRTLKAGLIAFNRAGTIECRVRNLSAVGACLEVAGQVGIPDQFTLLVEHDGFKPDATIRLIIEGENPTTMAKSTGLGLLELPTVFELLEPDIDRSGAGALCLFTDSSCFFAS